MAGVAGAITGRAGVPLCVALCVTPREPLFGELFVALSALLCVLPFVPGLALSLTVSLPATPGVVAALLAAPGVRADAARPAISCRTAQTMTITASVSIATTKIPKMT